MTRKLGTGAEAWFSYDENGRMLAQDDATGHLAYSYAPKSYRVTEVSGKIGLDRSRDASSKNNFVYDASGRVVGDASKNLAIEYDMSGLPVLFTVKDGSDVYHAINVYDPQGWRVGVLEYTNNVLQSLRTDIMVDGKKELERRRDMVHATGATASQPSVSEYKMLYGAAGALGRENAGGGREWYVKDYQGSLVMTIVNDAVGNVIAYEPYGSQKLLQANGDMPSEQYTGKEYVGRLGLYYFGARFFDPTFAMWLSPDPAGQYLNPYSYGGDPINAVDLYGLWKLGVGITVGWDHGFTLGVGAALDMTLGNWKLTGDFGYSHNFRDGSNTITAQSGANINIGIFGVGGNFGASWNDQAGFSVNYGGRGSIYGAGIGVGGANYWDKNWNFRGGTWYVETFAGAGVEGFAGYEHGYGGTKGRGMYVGFRGFGFDAEMTQNFGATFGGSGTMNVYEYDFGMHESGMSQEKLEKSLKEYESIKNDDDKEAPYNQEVYVTDMDDPLSADKGNDPRDFDMTIGEYLAHSHNTAAGHLDKPSNADMAYAAGYVAQHPMASAPSFLLILPEPSAEYSNGRIKSFNGSGEIKTWSMDDYGRGSWGLNWRYHGRNNH